jgi:hypothetical protein
LNSIMKRKYNVNHLIRLLISYILCDASF